MTKTCGRASNACFLTTKVCGPIRPQTNRKLHGPAKMYRPTAVFSRACWSSPFATSEQCGELRNEPSQRAPAMTEYAFDERAELTESAVIFDHFK